MNKRTLYERIAERLQLAALRVDHVRIGLHIAFAGWDGKQVAAFAAYYRARVPGLRLGPNPINGDLLWTGLCPVCQSRAIWVTPGCGRWTCEGHCSGRSGGGTPEDLEYLLNGEDCEATVQRLMAQAR